MATVCTTYTIQPGQTLNVTSSDGAPQIQGGGGTPSGTVVANPGGGNNYTITNTTGAQVTQTWCVGDPHVTTLSGIKYTL